VDVLVNCFFTEGVPRLSVLHVVCASESILVTLFFVWAGAACVPILGVETARVANVNILICKVLFVQKYRQWLVLLDFVCASWYVWY
jgi:hypothetical protein